MTTDKTSTRDLEEEELAEQVSQLLPSLFNFSDMCDDIRDIKRNFESSLTLDSFTAFKISQLSKASCQNSHLR